MVEQGIDIDDVTNNFDSYAFFSFKVPYKVVEGKLISKIKMDLTIVSLLGVGIYGMSELYFTNPVKIEGDLTNTYKINSSNFILKGMPFLIQDQNDEL